MAGSGLHVGVPSVTPSSFKDTDVTVVGIWVSFGLLPPGPGWRKLCTRVCVYTATCVRVHGCVCACALQDLGRGPLVSGAAAAW